MATYDSNPISLLAGADLSAAVHRFGKQGSGGVVRCSVAGEAAHLIIASAPTASGQPVDGWTERIPKVEAGGSFSAGDKLTTDSVGRAVAWTAGTVCNAVAVEAGASGRVVAVMRPMAIETNGDGTYAAVSASAAISPSAGRVDLTVSGTKAYTLADGNVGHEIDILCVSASSTPLGTLTIASPFSGESATHIFTAAGQRLKLRMTSGGWKVVQKVRAGSQTIVVGTDAMTGLAQTFNLSITGTVSGTLPAGQFPGERLWFRCTTAASTPDGSISLTAKTKAGAAATALAVNATTDYELLEWDGSAWQELDTNSATLS